MNKKLVITSIGALVGSMISVSVLAGNTPTPSSSTTVNVTTTFNATDASYCDGLNKGHGWDHNGYNFAFYSYDPVSQHLTDAPVRVGTVQAGKITANGNVIRLTNTDENECKNSIKTNVITITANAGKRIVYVATEGLSPSSPSIIEQWKGESAESTTAITSSSTSIGPIQHAIGGAWKQMPSL